MPLLKLVWNGDSLTPAHRLPADAARAAEACMASGSLRQAFFGEPDAWRGEFEAAEADDHNYLILVFDEINQPLGFFGLDRFEGSTARLHICPAPAARPRLLPLARSVLAWCWALGLEALIGITPARYKGVAEYARAAGGRELGLVPGMFYLPRLDRYVGGRVFVFEPRTKES